MNDPGRGQASPYGLSKMVILGQTGFIGRALRTHLTAIGAESHGYSSETLDLKRSEALTALDDVLNADTTLVLLAALTPDRGITVDTFAGNVAMVVNVARLLETHAIRKCVYLSTDALYDKGANPVREDSPLDLASLNLYSLAKFASERVLQTVAEARGIPLLILRPTGVFGPGDTHGSYGPNLFVRSITRERSVRLFGEGEDLRDHLYVQDLSQIIARLSDNRTSGVLNVASGTSRSFASIVDALQRIAPYEFEVVRVPRRVPTTAQQFDISQLTAALPDFRFTPFDDALRTTFEAAEPAA